MTFGMSGWEKSDQENSKNENVPLFFSDLEFKEAMSTFAKTVEFGIKGKSNPRKIF